MKAETKKITRCWCENIVMDSMKLENFALYNCTCHEVNDKKHNPITSSPVSLYDELGNGLCRVGMIGLSHCQDRQFCKHFSLLVYSFFLTMALQCYNETVELAP